MNMPQYAGSSDYRRPSLNLWHDCPVGDKGGMGLIGEGSFLFDDFTEGIPTGKQVATAATSGTYALDDAVNGIVILDPGAVTASQGIQVQWGGGSTTGETFKPAALKKIWVECLVKWTASSVTGPEFFFGLHSQNTAIIASSAMDASASDWIGLKSLTENNILLGTASNNTTETTASSIHTMVDATWTKLGFKVTGTGLVEFFIDGVKKGNTVAATIPTAEMKLSMVNQAGGVRSIANVDWVRAYGQR